MKKEKRLTIAAFMGDNYTEYASEVMKGIYSCAKEENVNLIFLTRSSIPRDTNAILSVMTGKDFQQNFSSIYDYIPLIKPDALILAYGSLCIFEDTPDKEVLFEYYKGIPCLLLEDISDRPDIPYLIADNYLGMYECVRHLIAEHGYKKIAFLGGPQNNFDSNERLRAYCDAMHEYGMDVTDSMIAYGDYTEYVEELVEGLLDSNPGLEAIAFANDNMAKAGYRVCEARGLVVGRDLAITGFDDVNFARTMNPPLSSVMHSSYLFSYRAMKNAIQLCRGSGRIFDNVPAVFHPRSSCGCNSSYEHAISKHVSKEDIILFIQENIERMVEDFFFSTPYEEEKEEYKNLLVFFFSDLTEHIFDNKLERYTFKSQFPYLKKLCEHPQVSPLVMLDHILQVLTKLISYAEEESERSSILRIIASTQQYVHSFVIQTLQDQNQIDKNQNWFVNTFTQDLLSTPLELDECLVYIMKRLHSMNVDNCYFLILSEPKEYESASFKMQPPDNLYLAAYSNGDNFVTMKPSEWVHISGEQGISDILPQDRLLFLTSYVLFSGKTQYGVLLCENKIQDNSFVLECSLQIGSFFRFYYLNAKEREIRKELESSLNLIKEQNSVLNFISEYDELTKLLNRRGFMEKSLRAINENSGKKAYILFADLDHLKEINDSFGHSAGDFSLQTVTEYLRKCLPEGALTARIGGDEFVSFVITDNEDFISDTQKGIREYSNTFNQNSDKPYYVEISVGICEYICDSDVAITELLKKSDVLLYEEKKHRRKSAKK